MEEERIRIDQGQVPEMEPFVMTQNPALPHSINAIFTPPDHISSNQSPQLAAKDANGHPSPNDPSQLSSNLECTAPSLHPDDDSDEGVGAEITGEKEFDYPEEIDSKVSAEDVNLVLAEFDSVTDVGLETGEVEAEVEDEDDEDDLWSYYKTEPQQETKNEDLIGTDASEVIVDASPLNRDMDKSSLSSRDDSPAFIKETSPSGSPRTPGSPRTVEGFVTSVELNAPGESYNTNLAINQSTEYLGGGPPIEQNSGPFSVYVSSSPEPASIEHQTSSENLQPPSPSTPSPTLVEEKPHGALTQESEDSPAVEVVHAQSTVEVCDHTQSAIELADHTHSTVEAVDLTRSTTEPVDHTHSTTESVDHTLSNMETVDHTQSTMETVDHIQSTMETADHIQSTMETADHIQSTMETAEYTQSTVETVDHTQSTVEAVDRTQSTVEAVDEMAEVTKLEFADNQLPDIMTQSITGDLPTEPYNLPQELPQISPVMEDVKNIQETLVFAQNACQTDTSQFVQVEKYEEESTTETQLVYHQLPEVVNDVKESVRAVASANDTQDPIIPDIPQQFLNDFDGPSTVALEQVEDKFKHDVKTDIDAPIDQMVASFHEDLTKHPEFIHSPKLYPEPSASPLPKEKSSPATETPTADLLSMQEVHAVTNQLSKLELTEQVAKESTPPVPSPRTPLATSPVPKTEPKTPAISSKTAPPKPSPRSVGSKPLANKLGSTQTPTTTGPSAGTKSTPKRPSSLSAVNPLRKLEAAKPAPSTKTRPSTTTSTRVAPASASPAPAATRAKVPSVKTAAPPKPRVPPSSAPKTSPGIAKSRTSASPQAPQSTATNRRTIPTTKHSTSATSTRTTIATAKATQNGVASSANRTVTKTTTTSAAKKPLTTKTTSTTTRLSSGQASRKPMSPSTTTTKTTSTSTSSSTIKTKGVSSTAPPATKDTKNTTNRMISTTAKTTTTRSSQPLSKTTTAAPTKSRFPLKTTKTSVGTKNEKVTAAKGPPKAKTHDPVIPNGENKIVEEETTVEVKEKIMEETMVMETHETTVEDVTLKQNQVLVNGDHS